ncbi:MAG: flagellin [Clostridiales bacterium]|nr:flagellin [Clostridiales bacterium]
MRINTNVMALNASNMLAGNQGVVQKSINKLSSGLRINGAADDAAGLAISEKMRSQIRGLDQAESNAQDGISLIQTAEGALQQTTDILQRMRELVIKAENSGVLSDEDKTAIEVEITALTTEIDRIGDSTTFNGKKLLDGTEGVLNFKIGANTLACDSLTIQIGSMKSDELGVDDIKIGTSEEANDSLELIDKAIKDVSSQRAELGAVQNRMEYAIESLSTTNENLTAAESRIRDVNMADEMVTFTKNNILQQSAMAMLSQANQQPNQILSLLR